MESTQRVLIVEDDESLRFLYSEELREEGYEPMLAKNGKEAIQILRNTKPDLIVLDIIMPVMDGIETLGRIIGQYKNIPVVLYSSYPHYREDFMSWAADAYLTKSSDLTELKQVIKALLEKRREKTIDSNPNFLKNREKGVKDNENTHTKREDKESDFQPPCSSGRKCFDRGGLQQLEYDQSSTEKG